LDKMTVSKFETMASWLFAKILVSAHAFTENVH
jgi:hypothetical protein